MSKKAVILNSGGLDSATCLAIAQSEGYDICALTFNYGQRHVAEVEAAKRLVDCFGVRDHRIVDLPLNQFSSSALMNLSIDVPAYSDSTDIPVTYVPARNTIFFSIALGVAEVVGAFDIFTGVSSVDYSGYPDCRPEYFEALQKLADLATKTGVTGKPIVFQTPLIYLSKAETILKGLSLGAPYHLTVSCYQADEFGRACGKCDSCSLRQKGFFEAGVADPTPYVEVKGASSC